MVRVNYLGREMDMKCINEEYCDLAKMVKNIEEESNVSESEVIEAVKQLLEGYSKKEN